MAKVTGKRTVKEVYVSLELSAEDIQFLHTVCERIGGSPTKSLRRSAISIQEALEGAGYSKYKCVRPNIVYRESAPGFIYFKDFEDDALDNKEL